MDIYIYVYLSVSVTLIGKGSVDQYLLISGEAKSWQVVEELRIFL